MKAEWTSYCEFFEFLGTVPKNSLRTMSFSEPSPVTHMSHSLAMDQIQKAF